jgi:hypothetical protein
VLRDGITSFRGTRRALVPLGGDETLVLERTQQPVEVAHLDALLAGELGQALKQVVAVGRPLAQEKEKRGLGEPFDAREDVPASAVVPSRPWPPHASGRLSLRAGGAGLGERPTTPAPRCEGRSEERPPHSAGPPPHTCKTHM